MLKHIFILFIKRLALVFLLIIQTSAFSLNSQIKNSHSGQWVMNCTSNNNPIIIYNENSQLSLKTAYQSCTVIVIGKHTALEIYSPENTHLIAMPVNEENGWLYLSGKSSINIYYSGIYNIQIKEKLQEVSLQLPIANSNVIYGKGTHTHYRQLRSANSIFTPLEFQSQTVTLLSSETPI